MSNEELVTQIQGGEHDRLPELWEQVQAFARQQANRMMILSGGIGGVTVDDLFNSGYLALVSAVESYNATRGMSFIGWYKYALKSAFAEARGYQSKKRDPLNSAGSLDTPLMDDDNLILGDTVADPAAADEFEDAEHHIYNEQLHKALDSAIDRLPAADAAVIRSTFFENKSVQEIAAESGVSSSMIYARRQKGLKRLRRPDCVERIKDFVDQRTPWEWNHGAHVVEQIAIERERLAAKHLSDKA